MSVVSPSPVFDMKPIFNRSFAAPIDGVWRALIGTVVIMIMGCNPPPRPELGERNTTLTADDLTDIDTVAPLVESSATPSEFSGVWETWQAYYMRGKHVGYSHVRVEPVTADPESAVRVTMTDQLLLRRGPASIPQRFTQTSTESRTGELQSFTAELLVGPAATRFDGEVTNGRLTITTRRGGKRSNVSIPWKSEYRGPVGLQQSLLNRPIARGEQRQLSALMPIRFAVAKLRLECQHEASIAMPDGSVRKALEIDVSLTPDDGPPLSTVVWVDLLGNVIKTYTPSLDLVAFDSTRQAATEGLVASDDILTATAIEVDGRFDPVGKSKRVTYEVLPRTRGDETSDPPVVGPQPGQSVQPSDTGGYRLWVSRDRDESPPAGYIDSRLLPTAEDSDPGPLIDSDDSLIKRLAAAASPARGEPSRVAIDLAKSAHTLIRNRGYGQGIVPASVVVRNASGDCSAHAILLTALLRARGIPARVVVGLMSVPDTDTEAGDTERMAFHMWVIAHVDDDWLHLDSTLADGLAGADRIVLGTHHLADGNEYDAVAPVVGAIGRIKVRIVDSAAAAEPSASLTQ